MSYTFEELQAPDYELTDSGMKATRRRRLVDWTDIDEVIDDLYAVQNTFPGRPYMLLQSVRIGAFEPNNISGIDARGLPICGAGAEILMEYATPDYQRPDQGGGDPDEPETWLSHDIDVQQQMMTHAGSSLKYESDDAQVMDDALPAYPVTIVNHTLTWRNCMNPKFTVWYGLAGKCNSNTFLTHTAEKVLFPGFRASRQMKTDGSIDYEVAFIFQARIVPDQASVGWNHFLREDGTWDRIITKDDKKLIPTTNFATIFS